MKNDARLRLPSGRVRAVLDTDAYNEIDDQFAIVYAALSEDSIALEAIYAAPFLNKRSTSAADGMEKSYEEILRLLNLLGRTDRYPVFRGAEAFLHEVDQPVANDAVSDLIERARKSSQDDPLYVMAIGAITNVATALLLAPDIIDRIVVVWLGGHDNHWVNNREFNFIQDTRSVQAVLASGAPIFRVPCLPVADHLIMTTYELDAYLLGKGALADYLCQIFREYREHDGAWSKVIWDIAVVAWLINPEWVPSDAGPTPQLTGDFQWQPSDNGPPIRTANQVQRDAVFTDLFAKILNHQSS